VGDIPRAPPGHQSLTTNGQPLLSPAPSRAVSPFPCPSPSNLIPDLQWLGQWPHLLSNLQLSAFRFPTIPKGIPQSLFHLYWFYGSYYLQDRQRGSARPLELSELIPPRARAQLAAFGSNSALAFPQVHSLFE